MINKNMDMLDFQSRFSDFQDRVDGMIGELQRKIKNMNNNFTSRLNLLDDQHIVTSKKLTLHDREIVVIKQDLAAHKLQKER